ncbi:MAG TPA: cbb3-type cytochrome oxidase assembly protein CcoS [Kofleriaceae bacterium]|nr:cbb3-type cytochrome oxidase assembly protein CcoS [Kofleriaceae bacterium]
MSILYLVLPLALLFASGAVAAFAWTVRTGQLDDVETPPRRILFDDERAGLARERGCSASAAQPVSDPTRSEWHAS